MSKTPLIVLLGPTASGKTHLGVALAKHIQGEIISADSRQVFKQMDIGTGKDLDEYDDVPYHLIDIAEPGEEYNLFRFCEDFCAAYHQILSNRAIPLLVGGTGMYLDAVLQRYALSRVPEDPNFHEQMAKESHDALKERLARTNPSLHNRTDLDSKLRTIRALEIALADPGSESMIQWPDFEALVIGLQYPRDITRQRITARLTSRLETGMIEEVSDLIDQGVSPEALKNYGLEYRYITQFLTGELNRNDMTQKLRSSIHQFAKQQEKWFRNIEKRGIPINWLDTSVANKDRLIEEAKTLADRFLAKSSNPAN